MKRNKKVNGSLTVEAAFLMPLILICIFALMYLSFYLHDHCRIYGVTGKVLHKGILTVKHDANIETGDMDYDRIGDRGVFYLPLGNTDMEENKVMQYLQKELSKGLFLCQVVDTEVMVDRNKVRIAVNARSNITLPGASNIMKPFSEIRVVNEAQIHNPAELIRMSEVILATGEQVKGVGTLKDKLQAFMTGP